MYPNADYDNVVLNGDWPGSGPWFGWGLPLADEDGDGVFTGSLTLDPNVSFEFVVAVTGAADGWSGWGVQFGQPGCNGANFTATTGEGGTSSDLSLYVDDLVVDSRISVDELVADLCGVCDGDNSSCSDCAGTPNGDLVFDDCGVCGGDNSSCAVVLSLGSVTDQSAEVLYSSSSAIGGFQFTVSGVELTGATSDLSPQFTSFNAESGVVLGFSFTDDVPLPAGTGVLATIAFTPTTTGSDISLSNSTVSDVSSFTMLTDDSNATATVPVCAVVDCLGACYGDAVVDDCGVCEGDGTSCVSTINFAVDMNVLSIQTLTMIMLLLMVTGLKEMLLHGLVGEQL